MNVVDWQRFERTLNRIDAKLTTLLGKPKEERWLTAKMLMKATGYDKKMLRLLRNSKTVTYKPLRPGSKEYLYLLSSIPKELIKNSYDNIGASNDTDGSAGKLS